MLPLRHHISPAGGGPVAAWDDNSDLQAQEDAVRHYGLCQSDWKSLIIFFLNSRFQALKDRGLKANYPQNHVIPEEGSWHER